MPAPTAHFDIGIEEKVRERDFLRKEISTLRWRSLVTLFVSTGMLIFFLTSAFQTYIIIRTTSPLGVGIGSLVDSFQKVRLIVALPFLLIAYGWGFWLLVEIPSISMSSFRRFEPFRSEEPERYLWDEVAYLNFRLRRVARFYKFTEIAAATALASVPFLIAFALFIVK